MKSDEVIATPKVDLGGIKRADVRFLAGTGYPTRAGFFCHPDSPVAVFIPEPESVMRTK